MYNIMVNSFYLLITLIIIIIGMFIVLGLVGTMVEDKKNRKGKRRKYNFAKFAMKNKDITKDSE